MDEVSDCLPTECGESVDGGVDRISELPDEIIIHILSFLTLKKAAATSVLSSRWLDVWKHIPHLEFDRISQLPNQIIAGILSFLPLREAAATSVLSSRWSQLWKHTPVLHFNMHIVPDYESDGYEYVVDEPYDDDDDLIWEAERDNFIEIVNSVTQSHKALSLKKFRIYLPYFKIAMCVVTKWLEFVFSRQVESLELVFHEYCGYVLEELLRESRIYLQPQTDIIFFQSLKRLFLSNLTMSGEDIELFLRNCPLLEQLVINGGTLISDVQLCGAKLEILDLNIDCNGQKSIKVSAQNLNSVKFVMFKREPKLLLENVPKLVEADFDMYTPDNVVQCFASLASCHVSQLQILNLSLHNSKLLFQLQDTLANGFQMPNLKELGISCNKMHNHSLLPVTTALIWEFPRLEEFKFTCSDLLEEQPAACTQIIMRPPHQHLKVFELKMSPRQNVNDDLVELMLYISNNCVALRRIIIGGRYALDDSATMDFMRQLFEGKLPYTTFKWDCLYTAC